MRKTEKSRETKSGEAERPPIPQPEPAKPDVLFYKCGHAIAQKQFKAGESIGLYLFSHEDESPELCPACKSRKTIPDDKHSFRKKDIINKLFR